MADVLNIVLVIGMLIIIIYAVLLIGQFMGLDVCEFPDSGKINILPFAFLGSLRRASKVEENSI
ncbi:MAG TPA: hypothetical protein VIK78_10580 [Ruminiclostridium sp.]